MGGAFTESEERARTVMSVTGGRMITKGGRGFMGQLKNWMDGAKKSVADRGVYGTLNFLAKTKEHSYLNASAQTKVGEDEFGNEYFEDTSAGKLRGRDRWVVYNGKVFDIPFQAASIPPTWHAWIHQLDDRPPPSGEKLDPIAANFVVEGTDPDTLYNHVQPWRENPSGLGMDKEYRQPGHWAGGNHRVETYESWDGSPSPVKKTMPPPNPLN